MAKHGSVCEFNSALEDWKTYVERLEQYFTANDVTAVGKKRAILLSACGASAYQLIRSLLSPATPNEKSFAEIVDVMRDHYHPRPSIIVLRYTFNSRSRKEGESIAMYVAELKKLSTECEYGDSLNEMIRDRLVCGVNDRRIQRRLLAEPDLTFKKAMEIAQAMEAADKNVQEIQGCAAQGQYVHALRKGCDKPQYAKECRHCGKRNHAEKDCRLKEAECFKCKKKGHIAAVCKEIKRLNAESSPAEEDPGIPGEYTLF